MQETLKKRWSFPLSNCMFSPHAKYRCLRYLEHKCGCGEYSECECDQYFYGDALDECRILFYNQLELAKNIELKQLTHENTQEEFEDAYERAFKTAEEKSDAAIRDVQSEAEYDMYPKNLADDISDKLHLGNIIFEMEKEDFMKKYFAMKSLRKSLRPSKARTINFSGMGS